MTGSTHREKLNLFFSKPFLKVPSPLSISSPLVLYGAGNSGRKTLKFLRAMGFKVVAMIDRSAKNAIEGCPVFHPDDPALSSLVKDGCTAVVTVFNPGVDPLPIQELLQSKGFHRVVGAVELHQVVTVEDAYWLSTIERMVPTVEDANWLFDRLSDEASQLTLIDAVALRRTHDPLRLRFPTIHDQYCPADIPLPKKNVRFIDGGAFNGDTLSNLLEVGFGFEAIAAFEPDPINYMELSKRARELLTCREISLWPCGLDKTLRQLRFRSTGLASSTIDESGEVIIQTISLDEALPTFKPTYVKLDVEGAEHDALIGMSKILQKDRPALAVSIYHKPADLWELPKLIDKLFPNSQFFLRSHAWNGFDLVLYVLPSEICR